ncbi:TonB-dependent receptor [Sphingomonas kyeonggiensis]|uniref:Iron complex outermembrane receptor protein n=1 Tax=Sphingomonas kyeonggiensis TaxID=1268553 RepID=A0A7W6JZ59_9SPHN|nr:TonB-dependent receptor [Sphingomonas kyeonggiensis]MBB4101135.1 iron complex outermembrane receptor protein [Sphingomonas kyeonggiensis]
MKNRIVQRLLVTTVLASAAACATPAAAQTDPAPAAQAADPAQEPQDDGAIIVTGIRQSLGAARDIKRNAVQFVDAIVSDDIGKLPDRNVAESLSRVSGIQVDRGIAEGTNVSVRGLRQNVYLFNGREIVDATGRGGIGLDQLGSSTYGILSLVPSELISRLEVTKLAGADDIAGALGGIVDINTRKPLDGPSSIAARAGASYDSLTKKPSYEMFGLVSQKFAGDTLGVLVSASYGRRKLSQQGLDTFSGYTQFTSGGVTRFGHSDARPEEITETRTKFGLDGVIQWKPAPGVEITLDSFYSKLISDRERYWISFNPQTGLTNATYSPNNVLISGTSTAPVLTNSEFAYTKADTWSSALNGKFDVSDRIEASAELSYNRSTSSYDQNYLRLQPLTTITPSTSFDFSKGDLGAYSISGINLSDPSQLRFTILFDNLYRAKTEATAARTDWSMKLGEGFLDKLNIGLRAQKLDTRVNPSLADIRPTGGIVATSLAQYLTLHSNPDFAQGDFAGLPRSFLAANGSIAGGCGVWTNVPAISQAAACLNPTQTATALAGTYRIKENFTEGYAKLDFKVEGALDLAGNIGVRYLHRDMTSIGNLIGATGGVTPTTFERTDDEWLPSATVKMNVAEGLILRLGAAKVVAFPNTADLNNGVTLNNTAVFVNGVQTTPGTGSGGAPNLNPFKANQFDASLEYYFGRQALFSVGLFYKDVSTFIVAKQSAETFNNVNYLINRKINGDGAKVKGIEALLQLPFYFLPGALDGFGIVATYSYIDSTTPIRDAVGRVLAFPGLSKNNANLVGYYEKGPISFRVAYNWRDDYLVGLSGANTGIYNDAYTDLSTTFRYDISKNFSLNLEANNLLNQHQRTYDGSPEALRTNLFFGRMYKASLSVKF